MELNLGYIPPNASDLEQVVIGSILTESSAIDTVADILRPEMFYNSKNEEIYRTVLSLYNAGKGIDLVLVLHELKKSGKQAETGGHEYLMDCMDRVATTANLEHHARIITQKYVQRQMINTSHEVIKACYDETTDIFDLITRSDVIRDGMMERISTRKEVENYDLAVSVIAELKDVKESANGITGIPSGFVDIDKVTAGWQNSNLIIVAARPAMGKSSFVLKTAINAAKRFGKSGVFFSLEMSNEQLMAKQLSLLSDVPLSKFRSKSLSSRDIQIVESKKAELKSIDIIWDDTPAITVAELRAKCRRLKRKKDIKWVVIDYLQLMSSGRNEKGNREQEISFISRSLKLIAKELNVPIIALSQLSRSVEGRADKRPMLSDLRESGSIEQDADVVCFLYRPGYYGADGVDGLTEFIIAKHRQGEVKDVDIKFIKETTDFVDIDNGFNDGFEGMPQNTNFYERDRDTEVPF